MLVLSRKQGERIHIGGQIVLTIVEISGGRMRLGIEAPAQVSVAREEILRAKGADGAGRPEPAGETATADLSREAVRAEA